MPGEGGSRAFLYMGVRGEVLLKANFSNGEFMATHSAYDSGFLQKC